MSESSKDPCVCVFFSHLSSGPRAEDIFNNDVCQRKALNPHYNWQIFGIYARYPLICFSAYVARRHNNAQGRYLEAVTHARTTCNFFRLRLKKVGARSE